MQANRQSAMTSGAPRQRRQRLAVAATGFYALGLAYLTLARGGDWSCSGQPFLEHLALPGVSKGDLLANTVAYMPLGVLIGSWFSGPHRAWQVIVAALLAGTALSGGLELAQACLPQRNSSFIDLAANVTGTLLGSLLDLVWLKVMGSIAGSSHASTWVARPPLGTLATAAVIIWFGQQTFPWVVSLDVGQIRQNLVFVKPLLAGDFALDPWRLARHVANWLVLGLLCKAALQQGRYGLRTAAAVAVLAIGTQLLLAMSVLSLEQLSGLFIAAVLLGVICLPGLARLWPSVLLCAALVVVTLYMLRPGSGPVAAGFSWLPVLGTGDNAPAVQTGLFFFACALTCAVARQWRDASPVNLLPTALVVTAWLALLEVAQLSIPGRVADTSSPLLVAVGFALAIGIQARVPAAFLPPGADGFQR